MRPPSTAAIDGRTRGGSLSREATSAIQARNGTAIILSVTRYLHTGALATIDSLPRSHVKRHRSASLLGCARGSRQSSQRHCRVVAKPTEGISHAEPTDRSGPRECAAPHPGRVPLPPAVLDRPPSTRTNSSSAYTTGTSSTTASRRAFDRARCNRPLPRVRKLRRSQPARMTARQRHVYLTTSAAAGSFVEGDRDQRLTRERPSRWEGRSIATCNT